MCMVDDAEYDTFSTTTNPRAKKVHSCGECSRDILPGEHYHRHEGLYDGVFYTSKMCAHCWAATRWLNIVCNGWLYGGVWADLDEHRYEPRPIWSLELGRLLVWRERRWVAPDGSMVDPEVIRDIAVSGANRTMDRLDGRGPT